MSIFELHPANAFLKAIDAAAESDRREAASTSKERNSNLRHSFAPHLWGALGRALNTLAATRPTHRTRSRTA